MARKPLKYGGISVNEQECVIRIDAFGNQAHIYSAFPKWSRKFQRRYGEPAKMTAQGDWVTGAWWHVPANLIVVRKVPRASNPRRVSPSSSGVRGRFQKRDSVPRAAGTGEENHGETP